MSSDDAVVVTDQLTKRLRARMHAESDTLEFERAARTRDQLRAIERITDRMRTLVTDAVDRDAVAMQRDGENACGARMTRQRTSRPARSPPW